MFKENLHQQIKTIKALWHKYDVLMTIVRVLRTAGTPRATLTTHPILFMV